MFLHNLSALHLTLVIYVLERNSSFRSSEITLVVRQTFRSRDTLFPEFSVYVLIARATNVELASSFTLPLSLSTRGTYLSR